MSKDKQLQKIKQKLESKNNILLGELARARRGVKSPSNARMLIGKDIEHKITLICPEASEFIKPIITTEIIHEYSLDMYEKFLINIKKGWTNSNGLTKESFEKKYKYLFDYLDSFNDLKEATDIGDYWWESRACNYEDFMINKIVYRIDQLKFAIDKTHSITNFSVGNILSDSESLCVLLNTDICRQILRKIYNLEKNTNKNKTYIGSTLIVKLRVPSDILDNEKLKQYYIEITKNTKKGKGVKETQEKIEKYVQELYGLTDEEIEYLCK